MMDQPAAVVSTRRARTGALAAKLLAVLAGMLGGVGWAGTALAQHAATPPGTVYPTQPTRPPLAVTPDLDTTSVIIPQARVRPWRASPVQLQSVRASIAIEDQVATTALELELFNPLGVPQEAQLLLPIPDGVTVRAFQYDGTGPEPTATILPREEARRIYDSIVFRSRDPGLLEFAGLNVIRTSVFPVPGGARQTVRLSYEQVLTGEVGRVDYVLPRSEALAASGVAWRMEATIKSARAIATVYSPSHEIAVDRPGAGVAVVRVPERSAAQPGSLRLSYITSGAGRPGEQDLPATMIAYPDPSVGGGDGGYFLLLGGLPPRVTGNAPPMKREVTLVIDRSGSMRGPKIEQARAAAHQVIDGLSEGEFFNIIDFSDSIASLAGAPIEKTPESTRRAHEYITAIQANGGTALHDALLESLRPTPAPGVLPLVLFLTDGLPTVGERSEVRIREAAKQANVHKRRIFSFGVGYDVNTPLLSAVSKASRGAPTFVLPEENVEVAVSQVFRRLVGPVLTSPRLVAVGENGQPAPGSVRDLLPAELPDFFDGDQMVVLGQYTGAGGKTLRLRLEGQAAGGGLAGGRGGAGATSFEYAFDLRNASARNGFVPRLWATRKIGALVEEIRQSGANPGSTDPQTRELVDEIVRLSTRFGVLTEYTSFLATERDGRTALGGGGAPLSSLEAVRELATKNLVERGVQRSGAGGVNQEKNIQALSDQMAPAAAGPQVFLGARMQEVKIESVQRSGANALFRRGDRWVDARILSDAESPPERTIEFGGEAYGRVIDAMARENLLFALTNEGELYLLLEGKRTLIQAPR